MIIFDRKGGHKMNSRIDSILEISSIGNRSVERIFDNELDIYDVEFDKEGKLEELITSSKKYLINEINKR